MKNIFKKLNIIVILVLGIIINGCEINDLSVQDSPNALNPSTADVDFFLNNIQQGLAAFITGYEGSGFDGMSEFGMEATRMLSAINGNTYRSIEDPGAFDQVWATAYSNVLEDIKAMNAVALPAEQYTHVAIGEIVESYIMMTLVDFFGDVPYSEALQGDEGIFNPNVDSGASIYEAADALLLDAIENLNKTEIALPTTDLYYNGDESKWIKVANTMRLKLYLQTRLVNSSESTSVINSLISNGNLIMNSSDDFQFQWSANSSAPDSRHPYFDKNLDGQGPDSDFIMANFYMDLLANEYSEPDPRIRYYFYRQVGDFSGSNVVTNSCSTQNKPSWYGPDDNFCFVPDTNGLNGYWGWDHLRGDGIPPHQQYVTMFGAYPVGGPYDDDSFRNISGSSAVNEGFAGAGLTPILLGSYTNFMLAEASLTLGTTGNARVYLEEGMRESINKVMLFGQTLATGPTVPTSTDIDVYVSDVLARYDAGNNTDKLGVIVQQYFIALWCNGIEAYNTYRRTGQPGNLQPAARVADPGTFVRSNWYPQTATDSNSNLNQKADVSIPVFWDTNPEGFVH